MFAGTDGKGSYYPSIDAMWEAELQAKQNNCKVVDPVGSKDKWYTQANQYWNTVDSTYDGVLGGYGKLSSEDVKGSLAFILEMVRIDPNFQRGSVLDCGCGIGRIAKELLCQVFKQVDLVDQCQKYVEKAKQILVDKKTVGAFYCKGLQEFVFERQYDCVWIQWVFSHLSDVDAVAFLKRAKQSLTPGGYLVLKENHCRVGFVVDKEDFSVTRSKLLFEKLFTEAGLKVVTVKMQPNWPNDLFEVHMYALR